MSEGKARWASLALVGVVTLLISTWSGAERSSTETPLLSVPASATPEPLIPTRTPTEAAAVATRVGTATPTEVATEILATEIPVTTTVVVGPIDVWQGRARWGVGVASGPISRYDTEPLRLGWYLDWRARLDPLQPGGVEYVQMIRLKQGVLTPDAETVAAIAQVNPGSLWLVGNEPDVRWQDNVEPVAYAGLYHEAYTAIKNADPTAQVAIGGVAQPTPLRLRYLEAILASYQERFGAEMPVDVWNVHGFVLREERESWGVDIPPGLSDERGVLYEIEDCGSLEIFKQQIVDFRRWMAQRGYQNYPLIVSEYGVPMPEDYGYPPERLVAFLSGTFDFFLTATDVALGYPADGYRLVQRWCWYSLDAPDTYYPPGRLFDPQTGQMTAVGEGWVGCVERH